jgi:hypothetical protein
LAATSPHERILARFREANGAIIPQSTISEVSVIDAANWQIVMKMKVHIFTVAGDY